MIFLSLFILNNCSTPKEKEVKEYFIVQGNPLLDGFNEIIDFGKVNADHLVQAADTVISHSKTELQKIYQIEYGDRTFDNTMLKLDDVYNDLDRIGSTIYLLAYTHPDSTIRNTALELNNKLEKYGNEISLDEDLYKAVKAYSLTEEAQSLKGYKAKFLKETVEDFERNGFVLSKEQREKLKEIKDEITEIGNTFSRNIASYEDYLVVSEAEIKGLSADYKKTRKQEDGTYKIDLSYPSYFPFMKYCQSDDAKRKLYMKYNNRAADSNLEVLRELLEKRQQMAELLGYRSYSEWRLEDRMARNPENVWKFEDNLRESVNPKADLDYQELMDMKEGTSASSGPSAVIKPWESMYIQNLLLEEKYQLDEEKVKQYFSLDNVLEGLFRITQSIFSVTYKEVESPSVWHKDVRMFEVFDGDKMIGRFYLDLYPRENKYKHAACFGMIKGKQTHGGYQIPTASLVCNFPAPKEDKPSLLPHAQVETLFHEFGHVLHHMLTEAQLSAQSGTSVARDFVEAPSQIFENWAWNYESLKLFAKHWKTNEILPKELFDKMLAAKNVGSGLSTEGQIFYGVYDLTLHDKFNPDGGETTDDVAKELRSEITHFEFVPGTHFQAAFGHLNGYGSSYYGYLWSKVYAEDMFSVFAEKGILDKETGTRYRKIILARGSSEEPMDLVVEFLGRKPNNKAFMKSLGL